MLISKESSGRIVVASSEEHTGAGDGRVTDTMGNVSVVLLPMVVIQVAHGVKVLASRHGS